MYELSPTHKKGVHNNIKDFNIAVGYRENFEDRKLSKDTRRT